jgi:hypothetical protein
VAMSRHISPAQRVVLKFMIGGAPLSRSQSLPDESAKVISPRGLYFSAAR